MKADPKDSKLIVLIDSHALIHRAYHALPDFATATGEPTGALYGLATMLLKIVSDFSPDYMIACYDRKEKTHRHEAFEGYKGTRKEIDEPLIRQLNTSKEIFEALDIPIYDKAGFEADDMLGTIVEQLKDDKAVKIVIASGDMDTLQLVDGEKVKVFTLKKGIKDTIIYDEKTVLDRFGFLPILIPDFKGLRGDPSDNIPGIAGIGEKTATTLITTFGSLEQIYEALEKDFEPFKKAGITERIIGLLKEGKEEAFFSKMLATIRRDAPIEFKIPEHPFKESVKPEKAEEVFKKYEFRTLGVKLKETLEGKKREVMEESGKVKVKKAAKKEADPAEDLSYEEKILVSVIDSTISEPTLEDMLNVSKTNTKDEAIKILQERIKKEDLTKIYELELELSPVLRDMERRGVKIDVPYLKSLSERHHKTLQKLESDIFAAAGREFNINSPKQLGEILFDVLGLTAKGMKKTAGGARSTKESELLKLKDSHPVIGLILEYRELAKLLGTYIDAIPALVAEDGRLHTHFLQIGAATGRMASQNPGLQNIPIKTDIGHAIRNAFIVEKGFKFVSFDYSQVELRIAAFLSGDEKLMDIFRNGEDVHAGVASAVFNVPISEVTSDMRRKAKVINFGILYGMGVNSLRGNLGGTRDEAQAFYNDYFNTFSKLAAFLESIKAYAKECGYTKTLFGRRRYFPEIRSKLPFIRAAGERMAINAPIQGTSADLIKLAMIRIEEYIKDNKLEDKVRPLLQVHDELDFEIEEKLVDEVYKEIKRIMENVVSLKETDGVPLIANASVGDNWGELEKLK